MNTIRGAGYRLIDWTEEFKKALEKRMAANLDRIGVFVQRKIVESFGSPPAMPKGWQRPSAVRKKAFRMLRQIKAENKRAAVKTSKAQKKASK